MMHWKVSKYFFSKPFFESLKSNIKSIGKERDWNENEGTLNPWINSFISLGIHLHKMNSKMKNKLSIKLVLQLIKARFLSSLHEKKLRKFFLELVFGNLISPEFFAMQPEN